MARFRQALRLASRLLCPAERDHDAELVDPLQWLLAQKPPAARNANIVQRLRAEVSRRLAGHSSGPVDSSVRREFENVDDGSVAKSYLCRVRLRTSPVVKIEIPEERAKVHIESIGRSITFANESKAGPLNERYIIVSCTGLQTPQEAEALGNALRATLLSVATELGIGLDPGENKAPGGLAARLLKEAGMRGRHLANSVHGLAIHEDLPGLQFVSMAAQVNLSVSWPAFIDRFVSSPLLTQQLDEKLVAPFELVCLSALDISEPARFMLLYTALETLADQQSRPEAEVALIDQLVTQGDRIKSRVISITSEIGLASDRLS